MIRSLYSAVSGMRNHQVRMDVIGNNIANVNTTGFKAGRVNFQDILIQNIRGNSLSQLGVNSINPSQIGLGMAVESIDSFFGQGSMTITGRVLDLAIDGNGFFVVEDSNEKKYYTRDGAFYIDNNGDLVNASGYYVLGSDGSKINLGGGENIETIRIDKSGKIYLNDETTEVATIGIDNYLNPENLSKAGNNLYKVPDNNANPGEPFTEGRGSVQSGNLEMSNVDLTNEFANMIVTQRGYQANARLVTVSDQMLQELIDLKR